MVLPIHSVTKEQRYRAADHILAGIKPGDSEELRTFRQTMSACLRAGLPNLKPLLPGMFRLRGRPYTLDNHFPFEPFFNTRLPRRSVWRCARQVSKSTSLASQGVARAACTPFFNILYVTPLFEMTRRLSNNYVKGLIEQSPVRHLFRGKTASANVLQRSFVNNSSLIFSYAFRDVERTRGIACDQVDYDEVQNLDETFPGIINETMSGSPYGGITQFSGTPLTLDNTIEKCWTQSSMAEWVVPCHRCHYENIPSLGHDLDHMIGPWRPDISEERPGVVCAKCRRPVFPRAGRWRHAIADRVGEFEGRHVPQIIMPAHYSDPDKWKELLKKRHSLPAYQFYNEVCGEGSDSGAKLITKTEIQAASKLCRNRLRAALDHAAQQNYVTKVLAIDWGGGGIAGVSQTVYAVLGMRHDGVIECIYGYRSFTPHEHHREAEIGRQLAGLFSVHCVAHDYTGAGSLREQIMVDSGYELERLAPCWYVATATQAFIRFVPATEQHPRNHYRIDKARSLAITCSQIRQGNLLFFQEDANTTSPLVDDFLALTEEKNVSRHGRDSYVIIRQQNRSDDFAQAVNIGCCMLWYLTDKWPSFENITRYETPFDIIQELDPDDPNWDEIVDEVLATAL